MQKQTATIFIFLAFCFLCFDIILAQKLPDLIPYRKGNKWGYCDSAKKIIISCKYDEVKFFSEGMAAVRRGFYWGYIDSKGKTKIPFIYRTAGNFYLTGKARVEIIEKRKRWHDHELTDELNCKKINLEFIRDTKLTYHQKDSIFAYHNRCFSNVVYDINKKGRRIIRYDCETLNRYEKPCLGYSIKRMGRWVKKYDTLSRGSMPRAACFGYEHCTYADKGYYFVGENGKFGLIDSFGSLRIPLKYDYAAAFSEGIALVRLENRYKAINHAGDELFTYDKGYLYGGCHNGLILTCEHKRKKISPFVNENGQLDSLLICSKKFGYINKKGEIKISPIYSEATRFYNGYAVVKDSTGINYFIDTNGIVIPDYGKWEISIDFSLVDAVKDIIQEDLLFKVEKVDLKSSKDKFGRTIYDRNVKYGFVNKYGEIIIPIIYDYVASLDRGVIAVSSNGKYSLFDSTGKLLTKKTYERITTRDFGDQLYYNNHLIQVLMNNKVSYIDYKGTEYFED